MHAQAESQDARPAPAHPSDVLAGLAQRIGELWNRIDGKSCAGACAQLNGDLLMFSIARALTTEQSTQASTDEGYIVVIREVFGTLDQIYAALADAIERGLHCHVGAMQVELEPAQDTVHVQFHLREAPGLWRLTQFSTRCA